MYFSANCSSLVGCCEKGAIIYLAVRGTYTRSVGAINDEDFTWLVIVSHKKIEGHRVSHLKKNIDLLVFLLTFFHCFRKVCTPNKPTTCISRLMSVGLIAVYVEELFCLVNRHIEW